MNTARYDCDCDTVIEMEDMGVGVEEILQYARAMLTRAELENLIRGLEAIRIGSRTPEPVEQPEPEEAIAW